MKPFYRLVSYLTHPIFLTSYLVSLFYILSAGPESLGIANFHYRSIVLNTLVFPLLTVLLLRGLGWIDSLYLRTQRERIIPTIASMTFYFWAYFVARHAPFEHALQLLLLAGFINLVLLILLGILMKPSMHTSSWAVASLWLWHLYSAGDASFLAFFMLGILVLIVVSIARMRLGAHTSTEVIAGIVSGTASMMLSTLLI